MSSFKKVGIGIQRCPVSDCRPITIEETATRMTMHYLGAERCYYCQLLNGMAIMNRDAKRGNRSTLPPNPRNHKPIDQQGMGIGGSRREPQVPQKVIRQGTITLFNAAKGYGLIRDQQRVFLRLERNELIHFMKTTGLHARVKYLQKSPMPFS